MPRQTTPPSDYPQAVLREIEQLGQHIAIARKRRKETQAQWAQRLGVSQPTMARIERGDPSVAMASYAMCMWLINQAEGLADIVAPHKDLHSLEQEVARAHPRAGPRPAAGRPAAPAQVAERAAPGWSAPPGGRPALAAAGLASLITGVKKPRP
ncbi:helix-turn-helix domain-containing protein [Acidovorax sp. FG27]|uniref:helix-turn-helix transcriptional regulator n=1 Tax=Acidovorax sp. FG27 TaxID=3133652 RepID=UPI00333EC0FA